MKNGIFFNAIFIQFLLLSSLNLSIKGQKARCLYMLSESEVYNFYYLKSDYNKNR